MPGSGPESSVIFTLHEVVGWGECSFLDDVTGGLEFKVEGTDMLRCALVRHSHKASDLGDVTAAQLVDVFDGAPAEIIVSAPLD